MQNILSENQQTTVVGHYERADQAADTGYQSENALERAFIDQLVRQGYEYLPIHSEAELTLNLRRQLERLNRYQFTDGEWQRFFATEIAAQNKGIEEKAETMQTDCVKTLTLDDGSLRNIRLMDKDDIHANTTQVINQYAVADGLRPNRYDVTILVNGLPLVHVELKRRGVMLKEAFNQINRYGRESFWAGNALFEYVQLFVISNGTETKYYSNTTRGSHVREQLSGKPGRTRTCNSYEFTSYWSDAQNHILGDLTDFTATFLSRHTLLSVLARFCVLTEQKVLMVMRPYQIAATERLLARIEMAHNARTYGSKDAGGYVWHTTGSGKTLTSFKAAQLATRLPYIAKVLFVVDRKDLDYQTMKEYDRFEKGAANSNTNTAILKRQLEDAKARIIITTIQKLTTFVKKNAQHPVYGQEVVMIFDECHRSQFGDMHRQIVRRFKKYYLFGFTGTPIFKENISTAGSLLRTTEDVFGRQLHAYTIVSAIRDHNVLPFRVDYIRTMKEKEGVESSLVWDIEREKALADPRRVALVARYILDHFDQQTKRGRAYSYQVLQNVEAVAGDRLKQVQEVRTKQRLDGFNSILAVQSIPFAQLYYDELQRQMADRPEAQRLRVATIFSFEQNDEEPLDFLDESEATLEGAPASSRDFLDKAIQDYNRMFGTSYDTSADKFPNYYKDVSLRMKNRQLDLLIVVNMFLTGFDATTLNTLWVDKNLRYHGLLQAYSRTNRILNSIKTFGNIVCFRNLEDSTNKCLSLFGDTDAHSVTILRSFKDYFEGFDDEQGKHQTGYTELLDELLRTLPPGQTPLGEDAEKRFIRLFGALLKMRNLLSCFDQFAEKDPLPERTVQDYTSLYLDLADKFRRPKHDKADICDDVVFEMELVKQVEVNIDYILFLVRKYQDGHQSDAELRVKISKSIDASPDLRDKKELIDEFISSLTADSEVDEEWRSYVNRAKRQQLAAIIEEERLKTEAATEFMADAFRRGYVPEGGMELDGIMPPLNPFDRKANRQGKIQTVVERLKAFFNKFFDIADGEF